MMIFGNINIKTIFFVIIILNNVINTQSNLERSDPGSLLLDDKIYFAGGYDKEAK